MKYFQPLQILYTIAIFVGGMIGYFVTNSLASLNMSLLFTSLFLLTMYLSKKNAKISNLSSCILTSVLFVFFSFRFFLTYKFMPAGAMSIFSLAFLIMHAKLFLPQLTNR